MGGDDDVNKQNEQIENNNNNNNNSIDKMKEEEEDKSFVVQGKRNQYNALSVSGCTIFALEAALQILLGRKVTSGLVDEIIDIGAEYHLSQHIEIQELLECVNRFSQTVKVDHTEVIGLQSIDDVTSFLYSKYNGEPIVAIVIKPPETIMICCLDGESYLLFDSHSRSLHSSAAFIRFYNKEAADNYLAGLFPICQFGMHEISSLQAEIFDSIEINFISWKDNVDKSNVVLEEPNFWVFEKHQMQRQINALSDEVRSLNGQLATERNRNQALEMQLNEMLIDQLRRQGFV